MNINDIISQVDKSWPKNYIIRFLYVKLAPFLERDIEFFLASNEQKLIELKESTNRFPYVNCSTLADFYINIFALFNINAIKIKATDAEIPLYAIIVEGDNGWFYLCPINDLLNCQIGNNTSHFGHLEGYIKSFVMQRYPHLISLSNTDIEQIDAHLKIKNLVCFWERLRYETFHSNYFCKNYNINKNGFAKIIETKLDFINEHLINLPIISGPLEREAYYRFLIHRLFSHQERKNLQIFLDLSSKLVNIAHTSSTATTIYEENIIFENNQKVYALEKKIKPYNKVLFFKKYVHSNF